MASGPAVSKIFGQIGQPNQDDAQSKYIHDICSGIKKTGQDDGKDTPKNCSYDKNLKAVQAGTFLSAG
jgi:hypothetical protein